MQITLQMCFFLKHQNNKFIGVDGTCILHATLQRHTVKQLPKPYCKLRPQAKDLQAQKESTQFEKRGGIVFLLLMLQLLFFLLFCCLYFGRREGVVYFILFVCLF